MHVIDDENEVPRGRGARQQLDDRFEEETRSVLVVGRSRFVRLERRDQASELGGDASGQLADDPVTEALPQPQQRFGPGCVGHVLDAPTADDERPRTAGRELLEQPGLADTRFTADQDE